MAKKDKDKRVKDYIDKCLAICEGLQERNISLARPLIERAAFMLATLEDIEVEINTKGETIEYQNGMNQYGKQVNPAVKLYTPMVKACSSVYQQFVNIVLKDAPPEIKTDKLDAFRQVFDD